jgi:hypothetical protein
VADNTPRPFLFPRPPAYQSPKVPKSPRCPSRDPRLVICPLNTTHQPRSAEGRACPDSGSRPMPAGMDGIARKWNNVEWQGIHCVPAQALKSAAIRFQPGRGPPGAAPCAAVPCSVPTARQPTYTSLMLEIPSHEEGNDLLEGDGKTEHHAYPTVDAKIQIPISKQLLRPLPIPPFLCRRRPAPTDITNQPTIQPGVWCRRVRP